MQALADVHDTPFRKFVVPLGLGVGWMTQPVAALAGAAPQSPPQARAITITRRRTMFGLLGICYFS